MVLRSVWNVVANLLECRFQPISSPTYLYWADRAVHLLVDRQMITLASKKQLSVFWIWRRPILSHFLFCICLPKLLSIYMSSGVTWEVHMLSKSLFYWRSGEILSCDLDRRISSGNGWVRKKCKSSNSPQEHTVFEQALVNAFSYLNSVLTDQALLVLFWILVIFPSTKASQRDYSQRTA